MSKKESLHAGVVPPSATPGGALPPDHFPPKEGEGPQGEQGAPPPSVETVAKQSEEERVAHQRLLDLQTAASTSAARAEDAKAKLLAVEGDLARSQADNAELRREVESLRASNTALIAGGQRDGLPTLPVDLPNGAFQLLESVTLSTGSARAPVAARAQRGDVVFVGAAPEAVEKLQRAIGQVSRVYVVDEASANELRKLNHIR